MTRMPLTNTTEPTTQPVSVTDIVSALEADIVIGRLFPKERLVEEDLMVRFDCKRHMVRQALFQLEATGLVERIKNRGAFVRSYTPEEVEAIYAMREILEIASVERIPMPAPASVIDELETIQSHHNEAVDSGDLPAVFHYNIAFHRTLFAACGNPYLSETINEYAQKVYAIRSIGTSDQESVKRARQEHIAMIDALKSGDRETLTHLCRSHLGISKDRYISLYNMRQGSEPIRK